MYGIHRHLLMVIPVGSNVDWWRARQKSGLLVKFSTKHNSTDCPAGIVCSPTCDDNLKVHTCTRMICMHTCHAWVRTHTHPHTHTHTHTPHMHTHLHTHIICTPHHSKYWPISALCNGTSAEHSGAVSNCSLHTTTRPSSGSSRLSECVPKPPPHTCGHHLGGKVQSTN